jgi:predicted ribosomally synthesized peptide with SipW-like signal peptide
MDDSFDISRRKALAALGSIGVASAGAGLGTSAYFSDQETFENNQLTAGTLDMKVAATEYYSDWSSDEAEFADMATDVDSADIRLPPGEDQSDAQDIALDLNDDHDGDVYAALFEAISTDADGTPYNRVNGGVSAAAEGLCGTDSDADGPMSIDIADVKPGDFGCVQFAFELCDNPGYVRLTGGIQDASENGVTEPGADDPDEEDGIVELLDEIQVACSASPINGDTSVFADADAGFQPTNQQSLREFLATIDGEGLTLDGNIDAEDGGGTGDQGCFSGSPSDGSTVHGVSVVWWFPISRSNQVQSDSATFDLGFYTEQCRSNDGETELEAYYPFEGTANDVSGNDYDGTLNGDVSFTSGQVGQAASFDGDGDYVEIADESGLDLTAELTISAWINTSQAQPSYTRLVSREQSGQGNRQYNLGFAPDGVRPRTVVDTQDTTSVEVIGGTDVTDGSFHHIAVTFDADDALSLYVDGAVEDQTQVSSPVVSRVSNLVLSGVAHSPTQLQFSGALDDVRIYSRALSATEIQALYDSA